MSLEKFAITKDEKNFDLSLEFIDKLSIENDCEQEWEILRENFNKIKYIHELINHYDYQLNNKFFDIMTKYIDEIDKSTQYYLKNIEWGDDDDELRWSYDEIVSFFHDSLNTSNVLDKIKILLKAYNILIPIIEDFRGCDYSNKKIKR